MTTPSASKLLLVDSSGWLEYFTDDSKAADFARYFEGSAQVLVPTIVLYEVYRKLSMLAGKPVADRFASQALSRKIAILDEDLALGAAYVSHRHGLAMADSIIYATAQRFNARLITSDTHFRGLPGVTLL